MHRFAIYGYRGSVVSFREMGELAFWGFLIEDGVLVHAHVVVDSKGRWVLGWSSLAFASTKIEHNEAGSPFVGTVDDEHARPPSTAVRDSPWIKSFWT